MRLFFSVFVAFVAIVCGSLANIAAMWFLFGWQCTFAGAGPHASAAWCCGMLAGGSAACLVGGFLCRVVAGEKAVAAGRLIVGLALILAISGIAMGKSASEALRPDGKQVANLSFMEASEYAVSPLWFHLANIVLAPSCAWCVGRLAVFQGISRAADQR